MTIVNAEEFVAQKFDYVVIGGGLTGLVLAARLSEDPNVTVGVIEAGEYRPDSPEINIPGMIGRIMGNPDFDWVLLSTPQKHANDRMVLQARGKALGGSSMLNFLYTCRASKEEYDSLEELGNEGWNWDSFLKNMKKSETLVPPPWSEEDKKLYAADPDLSFHGTDGPLVLSYPIHRADVAIPILDSLEKLGIPRNPDNGTGYNIGSISPLTTVNPATATRSYSAVAYYAPNAHRKNFVVLTGAVATKILFEKDASSLQRAVGVEFVKDGVTTKVTNIKKDVVISAGSLKTPQLLELSGVGNPKILKNYGIDAILDLPGVGENLQDHTLSPVMIEVTEEYETLDILQDPAQLEKHVTLYQQQKGFLSTIAAPVFSFYPSKTFGTAEDIASWQSKADVSYAADTNMATNPTLKSGLTKQYELSKRWLADERQAEVEFLSFGAHYTATGHSPVAGARYLTLFSGLMHPLARGSVHITSTDPLAQPAIDPNYLGNEADEDMLFRATQFIAKLLKTEPFSKAVKDNVLPSKADLEKIENGDAAVFKEHIKKYCLPIYHPIATAAMLPREDGGVVDSKLKVYGTSNLRIADLSILPIHFSCHPMSVGYAIGEKAAEIIKSL